MAAEDSSGGLSSAFTDLMTSLAVIFILLLVALVNNKQQELRAKQEEIDAAKLKLLQSQQATKDTRLEILAKLREELAMMSERGVEVKEDEKDPLGLLVVIPEGLLQFRVDRWDIPSAGQDFLGTFIPRLARGACAFRDDLSSIVVEGHADSTGTDEHNLKLSQDRSLEVVRQSLATLGNGDPANDTRGCFLDLLSASGRGNREPFLVNGVEDRDRSRRVVFKIRVRSFEQRERQLLLGIGAEGAAGAT
jgi:chemotaxis protein MotB